jgi:hypothetical protein
MMERSLIIRIILAKRAMPLKRRKLTIETVEAFILTSPTVT